MASDDTESALVRASTAPTRAAVRANSLSTLSSLMVYMLIAEAPNASPIGLSADRSVRMAATTLVSKALCPPAAAAAASCASGQTRLTKAEQPRSATSASSRC
eukprot:4987506-Prymnesium_polylepis.1